MFGFGMQELLVILAIVLLLFGPKRLKNIGSDLGNAIKGFRTAVSPRKIPNKTAPRSSTAKQPREQALARHNHRSQPKTPSLRIGPSPDSSDDGKKST
jgi:sec-independent protein translocase protein TatA